jgi:Spy/CpxP family protein refolding chaperone
MYQKALTLLLIFSLAFNIAFVGIWVYSRRRPVPPLPAPQAPQAGAAPRPGVALLESLRPDQRAELWAKWRKLAEQAAPLNAEVRRERQRLFDLMAAETPDWAAVRECESRIEAAQNRLRRMVVEELRQVRDLLTPEQRQAWLKVLESLTERPGILKRPVPLAGPEERPAARGPRPGYKANPEAPERPQRP